MAQSVLIVDDEASDRYIAARAIRKAGLSSAITEFSDGQTLIEFIVRTNDFRERCKRLPPTLMLVDINMPRMGGFELIERLEAAVESGALNPACVSVMMFSSSLSPRDRVRADSSALIKGYLVKPLSVEAVRGLMERMELS